MTPSATTLLGGPVGDGATTWISWPRPARPVARRSANRAARTAEVSLLEGLRPQLLPSRRQDPPEKVSFVDQHWLLVDGGQGLIDVTDDVIYLAIALRNVGRGGRVTICQR